MSPEELNAITRTANATIWLAIGTFLLAIGTIIVAWFTRALVKESEQSSHRLVKESQESTSKLVNESTVSSYRQLGVQMWLAMQQRFDSAEMVRQRKLLSAEMKNYKKSQHHRISETVLCFFEDVGKLYEQNFIDKELADSCFSFYICRWYEICKPYIDAERKRHHEDNSIFEDFESLARLFRSKYPEDVLDDAELSKFLDDEARLIE